MSKLKEPCEISRIPVDSSNYQLSRVLGVRINCYCGAGGRCWTGSDYKTNIQIKKKNAASPRLTDRHPQPSAVLLSLRWPPGQLENFKKQPQAVSYLGVYFCFGAIYRHFLQENELFHFHLPISADCIFCHRNAIAGRYWELDHHPAAPTAPGRQLPHSYKLFSVLLRFFFNYQVQLFPADFSLNTGSHLSTFRPEVVTKWHRGTRV